MDIIYQELKNLLNVRLLEVGETEAKIAKEVGCSQVHINRLKNRDGSFETLKLSTFLALFPQLGKILSDEIHKMAAAAGVAVSSSGKQNGEALSHVIQGSPGASININTGGDVVTYRMRVFDAIIELDIEMSAKDAVLRALRSVPLHDK